MTAGAFISVVIPAYNEAENIGLLVEQLNNILSPYDHEIILVNDGSTDQTEKVAAALLTDFPTFKYLPTTANRGQQAAILEGCKVAKGDCVLTIDADLQQPSSLLPLMIAEWQSGSEIVYGVRSERFWSLKNICTHCFYQFLFFITGTYFENGISDFNLIDKKVIDHYFKTEKSFLIRALLPILPFESGKLYYQPSKRFSGKSKYTVFKNLQLALLGIKTVLHAKNEMQAEKGKTPMIINA